MEPDDEIEEKDFNDMTDNEKREHQAKAFHEQRKTGIDIAHSTRYGTLHESDDGTKLGVELDVKPIVTRQDVDLMKSTATALIEEWFAKRNYDNSSKAQLLELNK